MNLRWVRRLIGLPSRAPTRGESDERQRAWLEARQRDIRERVKILGLEAELARRKQRGSP